MTKMPKPSVRRSAITALICGFLVATPIAVIANTDRGHPPVYPVNTTGLTYGSAADATKLEEEPDLILVMGDNGTLGYAFRTDLEPTMPKTPEEAAMRSLQGVKAKTINVYDQDGKNVIDTFTMEAPNPNDIQVLVIE